MSRTGPKTSGFILTLSVFLLGAAIARADAECTGGEPVLLDPDRRFVELDFTQGTHDQLEVVDGSLTLAGAPGSYPESGTWISPIYDTGHTWVLWDWVEADVDPADLQQNLAHNGDFEIPDGNNPEGWIVFNDFTLPRMDTSTSSTGETSLRLAPDRSVEFGHVYAANSGYWPVVVSSGKPAHILFDLKYDTDEAPFRFEVGPAPGGGWPTLATYEFPISDFTEQYFVFDFAKHASTPAFTSLGLRWWFDYYVDDHGRTAWIDNVRVFQDFPVAFRVRTSPDCEEWTPWSTERLPVATRTAPGGEPNRFIQFEVVLASDTLVTPRLQRLRLDYTKAFPFDMPWADTGSGLIDPAIEPAGGRGWLSVTPDGNFRFDDGTPVRFWATQIGNETPNYLGADATAFCGRLAQLGFNLVKVTPRHDPDYDDFIAACKAEGLYIYLQLNGCGVPQRLLPGYQGTCKNYMKAIMERRVGGTGPMYKDDPAIAMVQLLNEEQLHSKWRIDDPELYDYGPDGDADLFDDEWWIWLATQYEDDDDLRDKWGGLDDGETLANAARVRFSDWLEYSDARFADMTRFYAYLYEEFYIDFTNSLKNEVGVSAQIIGNNHYYGLSELRARLATDVIDQHPYWYDRHVYPVSGEIVRQASQLRSPFNNMITYTALNAVQGYPLTASESNVEMPDVYTAEFPLLIASYFAFHDWDMYLLFIHSTLDHFGGDLAAPIPSAPFATIFNPVLMAQMPAASRIFRDRLVQPAQKVIELSHSEVTVNDYKHRRRDFNWNVPGTENVESLSNAFALMHRVERVDFGAVSDPTAEDYYVQHSLSPPENPFVSDTGELKLDSDAGELLIDTPSVQGIVGFSRSTPVELGDTTILPSTEFSAISLVPLDGQPVADSLSLLLTAVGRWENSGWSWSGDKRGLNNPSWHYNPGHWGTTPVLTEGINADVTLESNGTGLEVWALTPAAQRARQIPTVWQDGAFHFELDEEYETLWYELVLDPPTQPAASPGRVPDGVEVPGLPLTLSKLAVLPLQLELDWSPSCSSSAGDYAVYAGSPGDWRSHTPQTCSTTGATSWTSLPETEDAYYVIVPLQDEAEGSYGTTSNEAERPYSEDACRFEHVIEECP